MISKRLQALTHDITKKSIVADIGCDHGYLLIELAQQDLIQKGYACDVNEGPLQSAQDNIKKYGYDNLLFTRLGNGTLALNEDDCKEVDTLVVAGMGGALITDILKPINRLTNLNTLILQPNIGAEIIREYLMLSSFHLVKETIVIDNDITYPVLVYKKTAGKNQQWNRFEMIVGPFILAQKCEANVRYLSELRKHWEHIIRQLSKSTTNQQQKIDEYTYLIQQAKEWENGDN